MGNRGSEDKRVRRIRACKAPGNSGGGQSRHGPVHFGRRDHKVAGVDGRRDALGVRQRRPSQRQRVVAQQGHVDVVAPVCPNTCGFVHKSGEAKSVADFVNNDAAEVRLAGHRGAVDAVVPAGNAAEAPGIKVGAKGGTDIGHARGAILVRQRVRQRDRIPSIGLRCIGEVGSRCCCSRGTQHGRTASACQRIHLGIYLDGDRARKRRAPLVGRGLEGDQTLSSQRGARVAAHRRYGSRVVEAFAGGVLHIDLDRGARGREYQRLGGRARALHEHRALAAIRQSDDRLRLRDRFGRHGRHFRVRRLARVAEFVYEDP